MTPRHTMTRRVPVLRLLILAGLTLAGSVQAQNLRFGNHRDIEIPDYATIMLGPFYSNLRFDQTVAYRFTDTSGSGTDFVFSNNKGSTLEDGDEFPLVSTLTSENYFIFGPDADLEFSVSATYMHFPLNTQEDEFNVELGEEGAVGNFSVEFRMSDTMKGTIYDDITFRTDYVDSRGKIDIYGGDRYEVFENTVGINLDWLVGRDVNVPITVERTDTKPVDEDFNDQEQATTTPSIGLEKEVTGFLLLGARSTYALNTYPASDRPDTTVATYDLYSQLKATEQSQVRTSVGYSAGETEAASDEEASETESIVGELRLHTDLTERASHELYGGRSLSAGYEADFDVTDTYGYSWEWGGDLTSASFQSVIHEIEPSGGDGVTSYRDWETTATYSFPVDTDITVTLTTSYSVRENGEADDDPETDEPIDTTEDYETWVTTISTGFYVAKDVTCAITLQHMERYSDIPELSYGRDIGAIEFTYSHSF